MVGCSFPSEDFLPVSNVSNSPSLVLVVLWGTKVRVVESHRMSGDK